MSGSIPLSPADVAILTAALLAVAGGIAWAVRRRRKGGCGGCAGCPHAGTCEKKEKKRHGVDDDNGCGKGLR